jgi:hypothetical protein
MAADTRLSNYPTFGSLNPKRKIHIFELRTRAVKKLPWSYLNKSARSVAKAGGQLKTPPKTKIRTK